MIAKMAVAASLVALTGCGGTTYGTGTTAEQQLVEDLTGVLSLTPKRQPQIDYRPRPGLVLPPSTEVLPSPQEDLSSSANPQWPESPEERLARIRAEATANQDDISYRPNVIRDVPTQWQSQRQEQTPAVLGGSTRQQREEIQRRKQMANQGSPTTRRYLSDPPTQYRQPAASAPAGDPGTPEWKKEREAKAASGEGGGLRKLIPWLN